MKINPFNPAEETVERFLQRVDATCLAGEIALESSKHKGMLLSSLTTPIFDAVMIRVESQGKTFESASAKNIAEAIKALYGKTQFKLGARYQMSKRVQGAQESITEFAAALQAMAGPCRFTEDADNIQSARLLDYFIFGIKSSRLREELLADEKLTFDKALSKARRFEDISVTSKALNAESGETVNQFYNRGFEQRRGHGGSSRGRGRGYGRPRNDECFKCGSRGHWANACPKRGTFVDRAGKVEDLKEEESAEDVRVCKVSVRKAESSAPKRLAEVIFANGAVLRLEVDSGIGVSILAVDDWKRIGSPKLEKSKVRLLAYGREDWKHWEFTPSGG